MLKVSIKREIRNLRQVIKPARPHNEDWNRMVWATFKPFMLAFILSMMGLYIANLIYYKHKWWTCNQPLHKIHYRMEDECEKVRQGREILPPMFHNRVILPLIHHVVIIGIFSVTGLIGNYINDYHFSHFSAYALAVIWVHDHYSNYRLIFNSASLLYNLAHTCHFFAFSTSFVFSATIIANIHRRMEYPKINKNKKQTNIQVVNSFQQSLIK